MDINTLHPHNYEAYQKIMPHFDEGHQRACVVHATGTGKSYIINAVSDHFERVLIMTTNMFTIDEIRGVINKNSPERTTAPTYKIYQAMLQDMNKAVDYADKFDLIVLDEFHHSGAEQWGKAIEWVIEQNPDAKVLGTSATAIRHSDGMRDMGEELFEGHVLSRLPLGEAWARKALVAPVYIMAVEDSEEFYNDFIKKIEDSNLLEEKKHYYREMARNLKDNYEMEKNAAEIIRKWLPSDSRRIIVFSRNIEEAESNKQKVEGWMKKAGFTIAGIYTVHSDKPHEVKEAQMAAFRENDFNGIKLMVAVDMLNEGVHIKGVDAVFFLRKTESPTIFFQQLGRCMVRYEEGCRQPVVFDFRNNVENVNRSSHTRNFFKEAAKDYDNWKGLEEESTQPQVVRESDKEEKFRDNFPDGINYTMDYGVMLDRFGEDLSNADWDANYTEAKAFYEEYGRFPTYKDNKRLYGWAKLWYRNSYLRNSGKFQEKIDRLVAIGFKNRTSDELYEDVWMKNYAEAKAFFDEHGHFPTMKEDKIIYNWARQWWRKKAVSDPQKTQLLKLIGYKHSSKQDWCDKLFFVNYVNAKAFFEEYGHFPTSKENKKLYGWAKQWWRNTYLKNPEVYQGKADMLLAIGFEYLSKRICSDKKWWLNYEKCKDFFNVYGHFPTDKENHKLYGWAMDWRRKFYNNTKDHQIKLNKLTEIGFKNRSVDAYLYIKWNKNYAEAKAFFDEHGHFPVKKENKRIADWARQWWKNTYLKSPEKNQEKADMLSSIGFEYKGKK